MLAAILILTISFAFTAVVALAVVFGLGLLLWTGYQTPRGLAVELIIGSVFLIWLVFEIKARRQAAAEHAQRETE
jgi:hypothetical protein